MYTLLLYFLFTFSILCNPGNGYTPNNDDPFWINPCSYSPSNAEDFDDSDVGIIDRILTIAKQCQSNINQFKLKYIQQTFSSDYNIHYDRWVNENNNWITSRLLIKPEDNMAQSWLDSCSFPEELKHTYKVLQQVSVGFEMLLDDASKNNSAENLFINYFTTCKNDLQQLLCEISDDIDVTKQEKPKDITRNQVPQEVRDETSASNRNLTNSIILRDYMIAIKYVKNTYDHLKSSCNYNSYKIFKLWLTNSHHHN